MRIPKLTDALSKVPLHITLYFGDRELGTGTSFTYQVDNEVYLVTNWHNVTGRHAITGQLLHSKAAVPDNLVVRLCVVTNSNYFQWHPVEVPLYSSDGVPQWYEHPIHGHTVDVVAIPISYPEGMTSYPINLHSFDDPKLSPGLDVFVLGFPVGFSSGGRLPIWKRGSIASEPDIDIEGLPKLLIDTATRIGLSGSPVIAQRTGIWFPEGVADKTDLDQAILGSGRKFLGIYSGRVGDTEFQAQLGIVWKPSAIDEIILQKVVGQPSF